MLLTSGPLASTGAWLGCFGDGGVTVQNTYNYKSVDVTLYTGRDDRAGGGSLDVTTTEARRINLRAYLTYPPNFPFSLTTRAPVIALFHGGGWTQGSPAQWTPLALFLASQGLVVAQFQYRLANRFKPPPGSNPAREATKDAVSALRWLRKNAAALQIDPTRIATFGDSAGGHLALVTSMVGASITDETGADLALSAASQLALAAYPVTDTNLLHRAELTSPDAGLHYQLAQPLEVVLTAPEVSPLALMTAANLPPTFIVTSLYDTLDWTSAARVNAFLARARQLLSSQQDRVRVVWFDDGVSVPVLGRQDHNFLPYDLHSAAFPAQPYAAANEAYARLTLALQEAGYYPQVESLPTIRARVASASSTCTQPYPQQANFDAAYGYSDGPPSTTDPYWRRNFSVW